MSCSLEDWLYPEDELSESEELNLGKKHVTGMEFKKSMKSVVKVPASVRHSPALWESEPESPPRKNAKTSSSDRQDESWEWSRDRWNRDRHDWDLHRSSDRILMRVGSLSLPSQGRAAVEQGPAGPSSSQNWIAAGRANQNPAGSRPLGLVL